jgi:hypothetical protein
MDDTHANKTLDQSEKMNMVKRINIILIWCECVLYHMCYVHDSHKLILLIGTGYHSAVVFEHTFWSIK